MTRRTMNYIKILPVAILAVACSANGDNQGVEYAPNMYHSTPYEPYTQIVDEDAGNWVDSNDDGHGEYYNSNPLNPHGMTMRLPPANTVKRGKYLPYRYTADSVLAAQKMENPLPDSAYVIAEGKALFQSFCQHCHGVNGEGDGAVAEKLALGGAGVANLKSVTVKAATEGYIFHVITHGIRTMEPHGSQIRPEDRWKIAAYVKELQKQ